jgi:hypothetical protein
VHFEAQNLIPVCDGTAQIGGGRGEEGRGEWGGGKLGVTYLRLAGMT